MKKISQFILSSFLILALTLTGCSTEKGTEKGNEVNKSSEGDVKDWNVRTEHLENGKVLFSVFPDPNLSAGKSYGYMFHFTSPFETFNGKKIAIYAHHKETGKRVTAFSPQTISEPSPGYSSLDRFTANFSLPSSGLWRYEVFLDDKMYGDVVMLVNEPK